MSKLTVNELKQELKQLDQRELIQIIAALYKLNDDVKHYLSNQFKGEEAIIELYEKTKRKINDEFFPERGFGKLKLKEAKDAISNFKKLTKDELKTLDLMLFYVEIGTKFTNSYGDIDAKFYNTMLSMFSKVTNECDKDPQIYNGLKNRLMDVVNDSEGIGWGYHEELCELYYSIEWTLEDE